MIRVIGDRVLVALPPRDEAEEQDSTTGFTYQNTGSASGLVLAKPADTFNVELATRGIVMQLGEKRGTVDLDEVRAELNEFFLDYPVNEERIGVVRDDVDKVLMKMLSAPFDVQIGDCVLFPPSAGDQIHDHGIDYVILREADILGVIQPTRDLSAASLTEALAELHEQGAIDLQSEAK